VNAMTGYYEAPAPQPHPTPSTAADDGSDTPAIGGAIAGGLVLVAGAAVAANRRRVATA
jgi:hypothetical protein